MACGLVLNSTNLQGLNEKPLVIAGEDCFVNGKEITSNEYLEFKGDIKGFEICELINVREFLDEFNSALKELDIEGFSPMPKYKPGVGLEPSYKDKLWRDVHKELKTNLIHIKGDAENIRVEPPFILGLKALLRVLGKEWAGKLGN